MTVWLALSGLTTGSVTFSSIFRATTIAASASDPDPTFGPIPATIWSVIEANTGIICACMPMLRSPFVRVFGPLLGSRRSTTKPQSFQLSARRHPAHIHQHRSTDSLQSHDLEQWNGQHDTNHGKLASDNVKEARSVRESAAGSTDELTNTREENIRRSQAISERQDAEKVDGKTPFFHI